MTQLVLVVSVVLIAELVRPVLGLGLGPLFRLRFPDSSFNDLQ